MNRATRNTLLGMAAAVLLPMVLAWAVYVSGAQTRKMNYGELLETRPLPAATLATPQGEPFDLARLRGKWLLIQADAGACDDGCRAKLYAMRQARAAQGRQQERIERVWLLTDDRAPPARVLAEYRGTQLLVARGSPLLAALPAGDGVQNHVYLVDPLGNLVLRYPSAPDIAGMVQDIDRLLRASRIG